MTAEEKEKMDRLIVAARGSVKTIRRLRRTIARAESKFRFYAELHARKGTPQGFHKALQNRTMADRMRKVLDDTR